MQLVKLLRDGEVVTDVQAHRQGHLPRRPAGRGQRGRLPAGTSTPSRTPRWSSTWAWPSGRTAKTPSTTWSTPTPASAHCCGLHGGGRHHRACRRRTSTVSLLSGEAERALIKQIAQFCEEIKLAARDYDPSHINRYLHGAGRAASTGSTPPAASRARSRPVRDARLKLADDTRIVLRERL